MPPLNDQHIGLHLIDLRRYADPVKGIGGIDQELRLIDLEHIIAVVTLFLLKEYLGILHLIGNQSDIMLLDKSTV